MSSWRERLVAAEERRAANAAYWDGALPTIFRSALVPAAHAFQAAVGGFVQTEVLELPGEYKVVLSFDDWHLAQWTLSVRLRPSTREEATAIVAAPPNAPRCVKLTKQETWSPELFLE